MSKRLFLFLLLVFIILNIGLGSWGLTESSEARYAEISREMLLSKDYINPSLLGVYHYHKPPITYWITTLGYKIFGVNEFGARFFLQIAIIIQLLLVYNIAQLLFNQKKVSLLATVVYFSFPIVLISSRNLTTDAYLTTFIMATIYFWLARIKNALGLWALYAFYICLGLAILTKGPVALLFVITFIIVHHWMLKKRIRTSFHGIVGLLLFFGISTSWYVFLWLKDPSFLDYFLHRQVADRIFSNSFSRTKPFYFYIIILPALLFPWVLVLLKNIFGKGKSFFRRKDGISILVISVVILILLFSIFKTKLILYILPLFWMVAIVIAKMLVTMEPKKLKILNITYAIMSLLLVVASLLFYLFNMSYLNISLWEVLLTLGLVSLWFFIYFKIKNTKPLTTGILAAGFSTILLIFGMFIMGDNPGEINSIKRISSFVEKVNPSSKKFVLVYNYLLDSAPFYLKGDIVTINAGHNTTERDIQFQPNEHWKKNLINWSDESQKSYLVSLLDKPNSFLILRKRDSGDDKLKTLLYHFQKRKEFEKWIVYYHN
ncbi:ArnT family glycosyltransferase [Bizionia myxarmorum]|uniref:Glycosyltransferase family 39 protein n=1 Tax=Bizionia myxarmorum TaxID=291186 RepID=A0A5D0QZW9_9FLAO|nr:glycosyltransferase family 39 protein [Bizionia myxarmorum]TYB74275.1 glycosyltransferase family 39 protein [Bizionia myxarmorum]